MINQRGAHTVMVVIVIIVFVVIGVGAWYFLHDSKDPINNTVINNGNSNASAQNTNTASTNQGENTNNSGTSQTGTYVEYSTTAYESAAGQSRVLFFHANWCPTCRVANEDIMTRLSDIPEGVVILKTDYDTETELKERYGITYQHVFVQVDAQGNVIKKWNGGGLDQIIDSIQ